MKTPNPTTARTSAAPPISVKADQITFTDDGHAWLVHDDAPGAQPVFWRRLDRPCGTCDGLGKRFVDSYDSIWGNRMAQALDLHDSIPCPDCLDGRHTFEIEVDCDDLIHRPHSQPNNLEDDPDYWPGDVECDRCDESGSTTHRVSIVPGMVLPIVDRSLRANGSGIEIGNSEGSHEGPYTWWWHGQWSAIWDDLPPAATPGMYAVKPRVA